MSKRVIYDEESAMDKEIKLPKVPKDARSPTRPSYDRVIENLDKWATSSGLQPPK
jgi:hypothetical protein